jgi:hypothetical protein
MANKCKMTVFLWWIGLCGSPSVRAIVCTVSVCIPCMFNHCGVTFLCVRNEHWILRLFKVFVAVKSYALILHVMITCTLMGSYCPFRATWWPEDRRACSMFIRNVGNHVPFAFSQSCNPASKWTSKAIHDTRDVPKGGAAMLKPPPNPQKLKLKKYSFCRYYDIKSFTWFPLQPESATEIGWWPIH